MSMWKSLCRILSGKGSRPLPQQESTNESAKSVRSSDPIRCRPRSNISYMTKKESVLSRVSASIATEFVLRSVNDRNLFPKIQTSTGIFGLAPPRIVPSTEINGITIGTGTGIPVRVKWGIGAYMYWMTCVMWSSKIPSLFLSVSLAVVVGLPTQPFPDVITITLALLIRGGSSSGTSRDRRGRGDGSEPIDPDLALLDSRHLGILGRWPASIWRASNHGTDTQ